LSHYCFIAELLDGRLNLIPHNIESNALDLSHKIKAKKKKVCYYAINKIKSTSGKGTICSYEFCVLFYDVFYSSVSSYS